MKKNILSIVSSLLVIVALLLSFLIVIPAFSVTVLDETTSLSVMDLAFGKSGFSVIPLVSVAFVLMFLSVMLAAPGYNKKIKTNSGKITLMILFIILSTIAALLLLVATIDGNYAIITAEAKAMMGKAGFTVWYYVIIGCVALSAAVKGYSLYTILNEKESKNISNNDKNA